MLSISKLPSAGLGNKLFSWAAGALFAQKNDCKHIIVGMTKFHVGPWLRGETSKRFYVGYFKNEKNLSLKHFLKPSRHIAQKDCSTLVSFNGNIVFCENPHWADWFVGLKEHRAFIKDCFYKSLNLPLQKEVADLPHSEIAVHIRMGDFRELKPNEDFAKVGLVRTPISYFVTIINKIRTYVEKDVDVTIFSDGTDEALKDVLALPNTSRLSNSKDILDLVGLSKSKVLITSAGSSFSKWAGFLSDGIIIDHYQHIHATIRDDDTNKNMYEGPLSPESEILASPLLVQSLDTHFKQSMT